MTESEYVDDNGLKKLPRFWKLRSSPKNYLPADDETLSFITSNVEQLWKDVSVSKNGKKSVEDFFRSYYCSIVSGKVSVEGCTVENKELYNANKEKIDNYNDAIKNDMGEEWYSTNIVEGNVNKYILPNSSGSRAPSGMLMWAIGGSVFLLGIVF